MSEQRTSGILLHVTSLPSAYGIGDLGPSAYRFVDLLVDAHQTYWQVLPLNPTNLAHGNSPYSSVSAFAIEPMIISPELLVEYGYLDPEDIADHPPFPDDKVDYETVFAYKRSLLDRAWERFRRGSDRRSFDAFCLEHAAWLDPFVLFLALKDEAGGKVWSDWPGELRNRDTGSIEAAWKRHANACERQKFFQYLVFEQWFNLKNHAAGRGVRIIGDIPIYVNYDSVDVWSNPGIFKLDDNLQPTGVAGVPPDYFSETGQLWGNPVYDWQALRSSGFEWWLRRLGHTLHLFDKVRIDHFRGLASFWEVPFGEKTAVNGEWQEVPSDEFFGAVRERFPDLPIIAEDLGFITEDVIELRDRFGFAGMKLVIFAFGEDNPGHPYLPHNYIANAVAYTGTHDNNTVRGWLEEEADEEAVLRLSKYVGHAVTTSSVHADMIRLIMVSVAETVIVPMQDLLGLGAEARMNVPSTANGNWTWRVVPEQLVAETLMWLADQTVRFGRA
ncbi:4-alpha-glucanotransferase [bacterium]|nr:4-alpha-glucanotransferase [bacterium]